MLHPIIIEWTSFVSTTILREYHLFSQWSYNYSHLRACIHLCKSILVSHIGLCVCNIPACEIPLNGSFPLWLHWSFVPFKALCQGYPAKDGLGDYLTQCWRQSRRHQHYCSLLRDGHPLSRITPQVKLPLLFEHRFHGTGKPFCSLEQ